MSFERRKVRVGRVVSDKMDKTVVVQIEWRSPHRLYKKSVKRRNKFMAHDAANECNLGDVVRIIETRPLSKTKRWRVAEIIQKGDVAEIQPDQIVGEEVDVLAPEQSDEEDVQEAAVASAADVVEAEAEEEDDAPADEVSVADEVEEAQAEEDESEEPAAEAEESVEDDEPEEAVAEADEPAQDDESDEPIAEAEEPAQDDEPDEVVAEADEPAEDESESEEAEEDEESQR